MSKLKIITAIKFNAINYIYVPPKYVHFVRNV